ncbi:hypothetical protein [Streptomyces sp. NPDC052036]|uniref:hypothetical protein n=1 Tax=Streptomyces sp. NPDC052036 TaxID=3155171 RepID=UPI00343FE47A
MHPVTKGLLAGAVGTVVLDLVGYGDMLPRGRPSSDVPAEVADRLAERTGVALGDGETRSSRDQAVGALLGYVIGLGIGGAYGLWRYRAGPPSLWTSGPLLGAAAMAGSDLPATALKVTDPASWPLTSWVSDAVPHLAYGLTTASVYEALR